MSRANGNQIDIRLTAEFRLIEVLEGNGDGAKFGGESGGAILTIIGAEFVAEEVHSEIDGGLKWEDNGRLGRLEWG